MLNSGKVMRVVLLLVNVFAVATTHAQIRLYIPEDIDPPFYANLAQGFTPNDEDWAVVFFYRSPQCIPPNFNLLDFIDPSGAAVTCPLQIEGSTNWRSLDDPYPASNVFHGTGAVPTWFVRWSEMQAAVADNVLKIGELAAAPSLRTGVSPLYHESVRNDTRGSRGGNSSINANGSLADGREFQVEFTEEFRDGVHIYPHVRIEFR